MCSDPGRAKGNKRLIVCVTLSNSGFSSSHYHSKSRHCQLTPLGDLTTTEESHRSKRCGSTKLVQANRVLERLPCHTPCGLRSELELADSVSVYCDRVR